MTMQNSLFRTICQVGIFMICAQAMVHFRPQEAYEKYLKLLVSVMVLIQLFLPIGGFLLGGGGQEATKLLEQFGRELEQSMEEAEKNAAATEALLERMTLEEVMRQLEAQQENDLKNQAYQELPEAQEEQGEQEDRESIEIKIDSIPSITIDSTTSAGEEQPVPQ